MQIVRGDRGDAAAESSCSQVPAWGYAVLAVLAPAQILAPGLVLFTSRVGFEDCKSQVPGIRGSIRDR